MIKRLVLDVLKPHQPSILEMAVTLSSLKGISGVNFTLQEIDRKTESVTLTVEGTDIQFEEVRRVVKEAGAAIHSIDEVVAGRKIVEGPVKEGPVKPLPKPE